MVGKKEEAYAKEFLVGDLNFIVKQRKNKFAAQVKIRYNHTQAPAELLLRKDGAKVKLKTAQFAVTPGQSAVFYHGEVVLGGGVIKEVVD